MVVSFCITGFASAADKKRDRKRDGSCQSYVIEENASFQVAADRIRDRKKDGSCRYKTDEKSGLEVAANRTKDRDRKRDGSCKI
jgi:hypothetical protein